LLFASGALSYRQHACRAAALTLITASFCGDNCNYGSAACSEQTAKSAFPIPNRRALTESQ
jgi:hypothetical protein